MASSYDLLSTREIITREPPQQPLKAGGPLSSCSFCVLTLSSGHAPAGIACIAPPQRLAGLPVGAELLPRPDGYPCPPPAPTARRSDLRHHPCPAPVSAL